MTYTRQNENGGSATSIIPVSSPLVTNGELDNSILAEVEEYKYSEDTLYQVDTTGYNTTYSVVNGVTFVPDYNDEDLFEHVYTIPTGDVSSDVYSWRMPFTVTFSETYQSDPGDPNAVPPIDPTYSQRTATRNIAVNFRTRLDGVRMSFPTWGDGNHLYYYADTYSNTVIIDANQDIQVGDALNGNTVTQIVRGTLYDHITFTGSNGFTEGLYGTINVLCGLGIKNKFGIMGWFFTEFNKINFTPDFRTRLQDEYKQLIENYEVFNVTASEEEKLYESCYTEIGAEKLKNIINDIYEPARSLNNSFTFSTFENTYVTDGKTTNYIDAIGSATSGSNTIALKEPLNAPLTFRGEYALSINVNNSQNLKITAINGNVITVSDNIVNGFVDKRLTIVRNLIVKRFKDLPPGSERLFYYLTDVLSSTNDALSYTLRKNYPSIFEEFSSDVGYFTVDYDWTLQPCQNTGLPDVDDTLTTDVNLGNLWDYPSTDVNDQFLIEGSSNEQYKINVNVTNDGNGFFSSATLTGVYTSTTINQLFGDAAYDSEFYDNGSGGDTEYFYNYKREHFITFKYDVSSVANKIASYSFNGNLNQEANTNLTSDFGTGSTVINVASTNGFPDNGWVLIPKYDIESTTFREYDYQDWEIIRYESKTATTFNNLTRGVSGTTTYNFNLFDIDNDELRTIPVMEFKGYGAI